MKYLLLFLSLSTSAFAMMDDPLLKEEGFLGSCIKVLNPHPTDVRSQDPRWKGLSKIYESHYPKAVMALPYDHFTMGVPFAAAPFHGQAPQVLESYCAQHFPNHKKLYSVVVQPLQVYNLSCLLRPHYFVHPDAPTKFEGVDYATNVKWTVVPGAQGQIEPGEGNFQTAGILSAQIFTHDPGCGPNEGYMLTSPDNMVLTGFKEQIDSTSGKPYIPSKDMYSLVVLDDILVFTYHLLLNDTVGLTNPNDLDLFLPVLEKANTFSDLIKGLESVPSFKNFLGELKTYVKYSHIPVEWDYSPTRERFPPSSCVTRNNNNSISITTDCSQPHLYQLESKVLKVHPGNKVLFSYNILGKTDGLTLILRDKTNQRPLGTPIQLKDGYNNVNGGLQYIIPQEAKEVSVLFYNDQPMNNTMFIINSLILERVD